MNSDFSIGSRLDSFLVAHELVNSLISCDISNCVLSDHDFDVLAFDISRVCDFGPGVWKFNNSLLDDRDYCDFISDLINQHLNFKHVLAPVRIFGNLLKKSSDCVRSSSLNQSGESFIASAFVSQII